MTTLLLLLMLIVFYASLGRSAIPRAERVPLRSWTWRDLVINIARGARFLSEANEGQGPLWEHHRKGVQAQGHWPDNDGKLGRAGEDKR